MTASMRLKGKLQVPYPGTLLLRNVRESLQKVAAGSAHSSSLCQIQVGISRPTASGSEVWGLLQCKVTKSPTPQSRTTIIVQQKFR